MKFLIDAQLPPALADWLREKGHEAIAVRDVELRNADDITIGTFAEQEQASIVTKDEDFAIRAADTLGTNGQSREPTIAGAIRGRVAANRSPFRSGRASR